MKNRLFVSLLLCLCSLPLSAQNPDSTNLPEQAARRIFRIGPALLQLQKPYKGMGTDCYAFPMFIYRDEKLTVFGPMASYSFFGEDNQWAFQGLARVRTEGYEEEDSSYLDGMSDRDPTIELGLRWMQNLELAVLSFDFMQDVLDEHRGYEFRFSLRKAFEDIFGIQSLTLTPIGSVAWRSSQLNDYYYGVRSSESMAGRPAYDAGGSVGCITGIQAEYPLGKNWSLFGLLNVEWLDSEISDSPIVEDDYSVAFFFGTLYEF